MADFDAFARTLLEESKRFLERAIEANGGAAEQPNLHAALMLAFCSLEAYVNTVADEMAERTGMALSLHEIGVLLERDVRLTEGRFELMGNLKIAKLEDRICLLHTRCGIKPDLGGQWRSKLSGALSLRNDLTHPKVVPNITVNATKRALEAVVETIDSLFKAIYDKSFPAAARQLGSTMDF